MMQGDMNMKEALEKNFHYNKHSMLLYINLSSNTTRHKVRLIRKERVKRVQIENLTFRNKVFNMKNASPRPQGDGFGNYLVVRHNNCSSSEGSNPKNPVLKSKYIIN